MGSTLPLEIAPPGRTPRGRSAALAGLLGWALPGLGHLYVGRPLKGLLFFAATVPTFGLGLALSGFTCVNPSKYPLEFAAHAWLGGPTALALHWTGGTVLEAMPRWFDVGRLYAAVAGLLNVVALSDVLGEALGRNRVVARMRRRAEAARYAAWVEMLPPEGSAAPEEATPADAADGLAPVTEPPLPVPPLPPPPFPPSPFPPSPFPPSSQPRPEEER